MGCRIHESGELRDYLFTVIFSEYQGKLLLSRHKQRSTWENQGGHIEPGESIVDAVKREVREETGLTVKNPKLRGVKQFPIDGGRYIVFLFCADEFEGELISSDEGEMEWIERAEIENIAAVDDFRELLDVIESDSLTEFIYEKDGDDWLVVLK